VIVDLSFLSLIEWFFRFFHHPASPQNVSLFRAALGLVLTIEALALFRFADVLYGPDGLIPVDAFRRIYPKRRASLFILSDRKIVSVRVLLAIHCVFCALLCVGFLSRLSAAWVFLFFVSRRGRNGCVLSNGDSVVVMTSLVLIGSNLGGMYSVDQLLHMPHWLSGSPDVGSQWATQLIKLQFSIIYLRTVESKLGHEKWVDGSLIFQVLFFYPARRSWVPFPKVTATLWVSALITWATLASQTFIATGLWFKETVWFAAAVSLSMHLGMELFLSVKAFQYTMISGILLFLPLAPLASR
jgi:hypothetical protein